MSRYTVADLYRASYGRTRRGRQLTEAASSGLTAILRGAIHHYGEELRRSADLPSGSPERLKLQAAFNAFNLAKERAKTVDERIVVEDLLHATTELDQSDFLSGLRDQLTVTLDALPVEGEGVGEGEVGAPAATAPEAGTDPAAQAPVGEPAELDLGVREADDESLADDDISDDDFKDLVSQLS